MTKKRLSGQTSGLIAAGSVAAIAWTVWGTYGHEVAAFLSADPDVESGPWGDTFGALNTLFGAIGFITVAFTLVAQRTALALQQQEFAETRRDQHVQRFEETFFELLGLMRELRGHIKVQSLTAGGTQDGFAGIRNAVFWVERTLVIPSSTPEAVRNQFQMALDSIARGQAKPVSGPIFASSTR